MVEMYHSLNLHIHVIHPTFDDPFFVSSLLFSFFWRPPACSQGLESNSSFEPNLSSTYLSVIIRRFDPALFLALRLSRAVFARGVVG